MTVAWEEYGFCSRCLSPVDEHHASCPENPLGVASRINIHKMLIDESRPVTLDWQRGDEWATPMSVLDFAMMVIHERLFRLTVPCIHCGRETTIPCQTCDHPQGVHRDGVCVLFPVCPCESFQKPMVCAMPCRDHRMVPEELVDAALSEIPELGATWDNDAREAIREGLFAVEREAQRGLEVEGRGS